ncbi:uncharacterized protein LOC124499022 [Dermatophagoides farinae]|uniref:uncharacterized protein LOC124499022 n=1 Tax=Dermatophagoides farinae TaxID=6954 RepID=UPI003F630893
MIEKIQLKSMDDIEKRSISSPSLTLEQMLIKIGRLDSMKSTPAIHHHPQTAKNFLGEFARFYNVGVVFDETPVKSNHEYQNPIISIESTKSKFQKPKRREIFSIADIQPQAECVPELKTIQLNTASATAGDVGQQQQQQHHWHRSNNQDLYYPHCIRLPRCGGCCPSQRLLCRPKSITWHNVSVMHVQYSPTQRRFRFSGIQHIRVEYHQQCGCECIQQSKDCNHGQIYRPNECRCVCSLNDRLQCVRQNNYRNQSMPTFRFWNEINCQCQCRLPTSINQSKQISKIENCPSGYHFNYM